MSHTLNPVDAREKDIVTLCEQVINAYPNVSYNPNGADTSTCPFCFERIYNDSGDMAAIPHKKDCAYHIAKDLSTRLI